MIEFLAATSDTSHEAVGIWAAGGGVSAGLMIKYLIDKLNEKRNGSNGKVVLTQIKTRQEACLKNQDETLVSLKNIEKYSCEQALLLRLLVDNEHKEKR